MRQPTELSLRQQAACVNSLFGVYRLQLVLLCQLSSKLCLVTSYCLFVHGHAHDSQSMTHRGTGQKEENGATQMVLIKGLHHEMRCRTFLTRRSTW